MHHSRLCAILIDCRTSDVDEAARFWGRALGRPMDPKHPGSRGNYRMLETPPDERIVQIQRVDHEGRVHVDIETDDIPAEVARLEKLGAASSRKFSSPLPFAAHATRRDGLRTSSPNGRPPELGKWSGSAEMISR